MCLPRGPTGPRVPAGDALFFLGKRELDGTYQGAGTAEHLAAYLDEFVFRFNRRHSRHRGLVSTRLLQRAIAADPAQYNALIRQQRPKPVSPAGIQGPRSQPASLEGREPIYLWRT